MDQELLAEAQSASPESDPLQVRLAVDNQRRGALAGIAANAAVVDAVDDAKIKAAYDAEIAAFQPAPEFSAAHILVDSEEKAKALKAEIDGGKDFAEVAKANSSDGSAASGGDLGWFGLGQMVPEFEAAVTTLEVGQVSEPVKSQFGWHLIKLNEKRDTAPPTLDEARPELENQLRQAALQARLEELRAAATIEKPETDTPPAGNPREQSPELRERPVSGQDAGGKPKPPVSPLAPARFPALPVVDGVRFAAAEAGVRYAGRLDVMLAEVAQGASLPGCSPGRPPAPGRCCGARRSWRCCRSGGGAMAASPSWSTPATPTPSPAANGRAAVEATVEATATTLGVPRDHVFVASTGVIGEPLKAERIVAALGALRDGLAADGAERAARAIMTTDTFPKGAVARIDLDGVPVTLTGFAKGSGMIAPDMATMLVFLFTDAAVTPGLLQSMVGEACDATFNCITVDGDTSTSDTLLMAATGKAPMPPIATADDRRLPAFRAALVAVMRDLAQQVVRDGEGATKLVEVRVTGAETPADARKVGLAIANSPLVKTAVAGEDPNWGRIVMAVGKSGAAADRDRLSISFGDILVAEKGWVAPSYAEAAGAAYMKRQELVIGVDLGIGTGAATIWTCDLTKRYIEINADYRS